MKIKEQIKLRDEEDFYLLINLDSASILKGYPSFFKINDVAKEIVTLIQNEDLTREQILQFVSEKYETDSSQTEILTFLDFLSKNDLCEEQGHG